MNRVLKIIETKSKVINMIITFQKAILLTKLFEFSKIVTNLSKTKKKFFIVFITFVFKDKRAYKSVNM